MQAQGRAKTRGPAALSTGETQSSAADAPPSPDGTGSFAFGGGSSPPIAGVCRSGVGFCESAWGCCGSGRGSCLPTGAGDGAPPPPQAVKAQHTKIAGNQRFTVMTASGSEVVQRRDVAGKDVPRVVTYRSAE